jgi:hypothetical protein
MAKTEVNKYGLSRDIPSEIKREIRKRCGFGCVICGSAIYEYEHIDPPFSEAKEHEPSKITLLCKSCHGKVTNKMWSKDKVKRSNKNPKCLQKGFSSEFFDINTDRFEVILGSSSWINPKTVLEISGEPLLQIEPPDAEEAPLRISAKFYDIAGNEIFRIIQNEWQSLITNWDIEVKGPRIKIRNAPRKIILVIRAEPPSRLVVERLNMFYKSTQIIGREGKEIKVVTPGGRSIHGKQIVGINCEAGIVVTENGSLMLGKMCEKLSCESLNLKNR